MVGPRALDQGLINRLPSKNRLPQPSKNRLEKTI